MSRLTGVLLLVVIASVYCAPNGATDCCHFNQDGGNDQEWFVYAPPDVSIQCHQALMSLTQNSDPDFTGYGWEINGCLYEKQTICPGSGGCDWCFDDCDDGGDGQDDSTIGLGSNSPLTDWDDNNFSNDCGLSTTFIRTWNSNSVCGSGPIFATQSISVIDTITPQLCIPDSISYECTPTAISLLEPDLNNYFGSADVRDHCSPLDDSDIVETASYTAPDTITRTFSVTDGCNPTGGIQIITLVDTTPPILERLPNVYQECNIVIDQTPPSATDVCFYSSASPPGFTDVIYLGSCPGKYTIERTWTSVDLSLNIAVETQYIVLDDTTPPVVNPVVLSSVTVESVNCFNEIDLDRYTQVDACSGNGIPLNVPSEISISHGEDEGRTEVLVTYTTSDTCGNSYQFADLWQVDSGIGIFSDTISGPSPNAVDKGVPFTITIDIETTNTCTPFGIIIVDAGYATLVPLGSDICFVQAGTGLIYCDPVPTTTPASLVLNLVVPSNFLGTDLLISVSWQYNYRTIGIFVGHYTVHFN